jgi:signal peptidase I
LFYFGFLKFDLKTDVKFIELIRKLYQYVPFVFLAVFILRRAGKSKCSVSFDFICEILWLALFILSLIILYQLDEKRVYKNNPELEKEKLNKFNNKKSIGKKIIWEIFDWIDAFVYAALMVAVINMFFFQLYEIPSESMVSEFLVKDRVVGVKFLSGPKFPLSDCGFPAIKDYKRGEVVIFRNPHYTRDDSTDAKDFLNQLVFMLTFTGVNLNVDETGQPKADPLVKRVCGLPGEQLMMQDGVLYKRTKDSNVFEPVAQDSQWALWNADALPNTIKKDVQDIPLSNAQYNSMLEVEKARNALSYDELKKDLNDILNSFEKISASFPGNKGVFDKELFSLQELYVYNLFARNDDFARKILSSAGGTEYFRHFLTDWQASIPENTDLYTEANFKLNLMIKKVFGNLILRNVSLISKGVSASEIMLDPERLSLLKEAENLYLYVVLLDRRNMPVFPKNDINGNPVYIPKKNYFLMGDNRFNSLDMRHSYEQHLAPVTDLDNLSVSYYTNMSQQYVPYKSILGTAALRFWPINRFGLPSKAKR